MRLAVLSLLLPLGLAAVDYHAQFDPGSFPILDVAAGYISEQLGGITGSGAMTGTQCALDRPCLDGSCCNSDGWCGFTKDHCAPEAPKTCLSNCDAKAHCGVDSADGETQCPLNLCCSKLGWCGMGDLFCGDNSQGRFGNTADENPPQCDNSDSAGKGRKFGYYQGYNTRTRACNVVYPDQIKHEGFTHLVWAFASIHPTTFEIVADDEADHKWFNQFTQLRKFNVQTWISVGGWHFSNNKHTKWIWSAMVSSDENRAKFVKSVVPFLDKFGFQGLDLDWEWPGNPDRGGQPGDKENQVKLVKELREAFGTKYGLSSILPADYWFQMGTDPKGMEPYVDFFGFIGYDLYGDWNTDVVKPQASIGDIEKNIKPMWNAKLDPKKINLGIPYYGRGFTLKDSKCNYPGCPKKGLKGGNRAARCSEYTPGDGFMSNRNIWNHINDGQLKPSTIDGAFQKQVTWDDQWIGFDDWETVRNKTEWADNKCLGGLMVWSVDFDGPQGTGDSPVDTIAPGPSSSQAPASSQVFGSSWSAGSSKAPQSSGASSSQAPQSSWAPSQSSQAQGSSKAPQSSQAPGSPVPTNNEVYPPSDFWNNPGPVQCNKPCTLVFPPLTLSQNITVSWPPLTTTLHTISGGSTSYSTTVFTWSEGGSTTQYTSVMLTIIGGSTGTLTTTISIPPVETNVISWYHVSVDTTDSDSTTFYPVPSIPPPAFSVSIPTGVLPVPPELQPGNPIASPTDNLIWIQPQPTIPVQLPWPVPSGSDSSTTPSATWPWGVPLPSCPWALPIKSCTPWPSGVDTAKCSDFVPWTSCFANLPTPTISSVTWPSGSPLPSCPFTSPIKSCTPWPSGIDTAKCPDFVPWTSCFTGLPTPTISSATWPSGIPLPSCPYSFLIKSCTPWPTGVETSHCPETTPWTACFTGLPTPTISLVTWPFGIPLPSCPTSIAIKSCTPWPSGVETSHCPETTPWTSCFAGLPSGMGPSTSSGTTSEAPKVTYVEGDPTSTSTATSTCTKDCGDGKEGGGKGRSCQLLGCGCGPLGLPFGPGCGIDVKLPDFWPDLKRLPEFPELPGFPPFKPKFPCGILGCDGGCALWGCGGGCGLLGCVPGCFLPGKCKVCPFGLCDGLKCLAGKCGPFLHVPELILPPGAPPGKPPPKCEEKDMSTVTNYFVSCTSNPGWFTAVCTTKWSMLLQGCGVKATTISTTKTGGCTGAPVGLNDDQGDDHMTKPPTLTATNTGNAFQATNAKRTLVIETVTIRQQTSAMKTG